MKEVEMSPIVSSWLSRRGYSVWAEVHWLGYHIDLVATRDDFAYPIGIELKLTLSRGLKIQVQRLAMGTPLCWGVVATNPNQNGIDWMGNNGYGLATIVSGEVEILSSPYRKAPTMPTGYDRRILTYKESYYSIHPETGTLNGIGGGHPGAPAQRVFDMIQEYMHEHPGASWEQVYLAIPNHYAHARSMASAMKTLIEFGKKEAVISLPTRIKKNRQRNMPI